MHRYRRALHAFLLSRSSGGGGEHKKLGSVTWEVSRTDGIHLHWQFLPVPADLIRRGLVEAAFKVEAENEKYPVTFRRGGKDMGDGTVEKGDFFRVWMWVPADGLEEEDDDDDDDEGQTEADTAAAEEGLENSGKEKCIVLPLNEGFRFDLQFGRRVMAKLLGLDGRRDWRECGQTDEEERADAERFKEVFKRFDWTLEE
ncbi:MAG: hypothetical protein Q9223_002970 [Gallowayella weberi]